MGENLSRRPTTPDQKTPIFAENEMFHRQEVPLPRANEPLAVVTVLRLVGDEGGLVIGGGLGHCGGSFDS
jgi:hypothetical protein